MKVTRGNRLHIGFYGKRNVGKSTLFNLILGQDYSIVSPVAGTTTDVNLKSMELLGVGPVTLMDCAGVDDVGALGEERVEKTLKTLERADVAIYIYEGELDCWDKGLLARLEDKKIPYIIVKKSDFSLGGEITHIIEKLKEVIPSSREDALLPDGLEKGDVAVLVIPIDKEAPQGRLILPQVQTLRALLDNSCISVVCRVDELVETLNMIKTKPKIVITDSQAFREVSERVPRDIPLTSYSIMFARLKGDLGAFREGLNALDTIENGDKILILESCTHHAIEDDIGRVKIPNLVRKYTGVEPIFEHYSGFDMPQNLSDYKLIIHCGACMTNRTEILRRIELAKEASVGITNYGVIIAKCLGILDRALEPFK